MNLLKIIKDINQAKQAITNFTNGVITEQQLSVELQNLNIIACDSYKEARTQEKPTEVVNILVEEDLPTITANELKGNLFITDGKRIVFRIEDDKDGVLFKDPTGYSIAIPNKQLHLLKKADKVEDANGLIWNLTETYDENDICAENELGDKVLGLKEVQKIIDGHNIY